MRTLKIPDWCVVGRIVEVQYPIEITGDSGFWKEQIISYSDNGFFTHAHNCPVYHHTFDEWNKTVREVKEK